MTDIISLIGTIASIGSIPLGFYFFIKGKEEKRDKIKRDIVRILLYQLNDTNLVSIFEIQSIINSKCRDGKVDINSISISEIIDDLLSEIISNPLLQKENKNLFINNLKFLSLRILTEEEINFKTDTITSEKFEDLDSKKLEIEIQKAQVEFKQKDKSDSLSQIFIPTTSIIALLVSVLGSSIDTFFNNDFLKEVFLRNNFQWAIIIGFIASILGAILSSYLIKKSSNKIKK